jgi:misacylated tRNA(Ala) deacylase
MEGSGMTERLFMDDATLDSCSARVLQARPDGIILDRTVFYARSGGQAGDTGTLSWDGGTTAVTDTVKGESDVIVHLPAPDAALPPAGAAVTAHVHWPRREALMRMHTTLHLLCAVLPGIAVTGGAVNPDRSRLDFDLPNPPTREEVEAHLNSLIEADHPVTTEWVDENVLDTNPGLVRTLSVRPPRGTGRLRLVRIGAGDVPIDLQPCGGTHVARTGLIGRMAVQKIENKGKQNRRIIVAPSA